MLSATDLLTLTIAVMGFTTVILSICVAITFRSVARRKDGSSSKLSNALFWQLIGEATIGTGTLLFSWAAHIGHLDTWSLETQSLIRFTMFFATSITTIHLRCTMSRIDP